MWRHNLRGEFNVGYGGQARRWAISEHSLIQVSKVLRKANIQCSDFEAVIDDCFNGDFVFVDPLYCPGELMYKNQHYGCQKFTFEDYQRLIQILTKVGKRGVRWAMTTSNHPTILDICNGFHGLDVPCGTGRMPGQRIANSGEILITNYKTGGSRKL
jgi:DNA adenine methylase